MKLETNCDIYWDKKRNILAVFTLAWLMPCLWAVTENIKFVRLSIEDGLSQSIVTSIIQDRRGFMWFGTEDGLNTYDGYNFSVLRHNSGNPNSLSHNNIYALHQDRSGIIWVGTFYGGLTGFNPATGKFVRYSRIPGDPGSLSNDVVWCICEDREGKLWVGTSGGLNRFDKDTGKFTHYLHDPQNSGSLSADRVYCILEDRAGNIWAGTGGGGLNRLDRESGSFVHYRHRPGDAGSLSNDTVRVLRQDRRGGLWIGTDGGLNRMTPGTGTFVHYRHRPGDPVSLGHDEIYALFEDHSGALWIGTNGGGLDKLPAEGKRIINYIKHPNDPRSLSYNEIRAIFQDRSGVIWVGTYGGGISKFHGKRKPFVHYQPDPEDPNSLSHEIVWSICEDRGGILWIGTHGGGLDRFDRKTSGFTHYRAGGGEGSISHDIVRNVYEGREGAIWAGTHGGGLNRFDKESQTFTTYRFDPQDPTSLSHDQTRAIYQDRAGALWIGTYGGGLNRFNREEKNFTRFRHDDAVPHSLSNDVVRAIIEEPGGAFWIGTYGGGLNLMDRSTGRFRHYRANPGDPAGLSNDYIFTLHVDAKGVLWIGTWGGGLNRYERGSQTFIHFRTEDGLPNNGIYGILEDGLGHLWLSTTSGLSRFDPVSKTFKNYTEIDGLQSNEFNGGSYFKSAGGEMFFGGIQGFNAFFPEKIVDNPHIPPVVITVFRKMNRVVQLDKPIREVRELSLSYRDYFFSFEFTALDYSVPSKNRYAYKMEGLDNQWISVDARTRRASFTTLAPGTYRFRVKGSNNDGIWNQEGMSIKVVITPPFWARWWFRFLVALSVLMAVVIFYRGNLRNVKLKTQLQAAHDAQMSIMPQEDPKIRGYDISGICIPAHDVGGDFFDYIWLDREKNHFGIVVGDVSGKAMLSAMTAVMCSGIIYARSDESHSVADIMTRANRTLYFKSDKKMFTALCLAALDTWNRTLEFTDAGLNEPLLKRNGAVSPIPGEGSRVPLGVLRDNRYKEKKVTLSAGDMVVLFTDGVTEAENSAGDFYGIPRLKNLLHGLNTGNLSAGGIKSRIVEDVQLFANGAPQHDDITVVVIKVKGGEKSSR